MTKTIVLVHGAWLNAYSWQGFKARYEARGYRVVAESWPFDERPPAELRAAPHPELAKVGFKAILDHYEAIIRAEPEPPFVIGHSVGGTFTQMLLDRGLGAAGVAINPAPTPGVPLGRQAMRSALPVFTAFGSWRRVMQMTRPFFATRFAQTLPDAEKDATYDRYIVPTPGKVYWDGLLKRAGGIQWDSARRPPLLLIAGGQDLIADASMTEAIFRKQQRAKSATELKLFPDRSHWTCLEQGWEQVADTALAWLEQRG